MDLGDALDGFQVFGQESTILLCFLIQVNFKIYFTCIRGVHDHLIANMMQYWKDMG